VLEKKKEMSKKQNNSHTAYKLLPILIKKKKLSGAYFVSNSRKTMVFDPVIYAND
jgi:hypothetical protein